MRQFDLSTGWSTAATPSTGLSFSIANNQSTTNVTGLLFSSSDYRGAVVEYDIRRKTGSSERRAIGHLYLAYDTTAESWQILDQVEHNYGTELGVEFSVTSGGQVQYASDNQSGTSYDGTSTFIVSRRF